MVPRTMRLKKARFTAHGIGSAELKVSMGLPKANLGTMCAPRRLARYTFAATPLSSTAMSIAELPIPSTTTERPSKPSGPT